MNLLTDAQINQLSLPEATAYIERYSREIQSRAEKLRRVVEAQSQELTDLAKEGINFMNKGLKSQLGQDPQNFDYFKLTSLKSARSKLRHLRDILASDKTTVAGLKQIRATRAANAVKFLQSRGINTSKFTEDQLASFWRVIRHFIDTGWSSDEAITRVEQAPIDLIETEDYDEILDWLEENTI